MEKRIQHTLIGGGIGLGVGFAAAKVMKKTGSCMFILAGAGLLLGAALTYATCKHKEIKKEETPKAPESKQPVKETAQL